MGCFRKIKGFGLNRDDGRVTYDNIQENITICVTFYGKLCIMLLLRYVLSPGLGLFVYLIRKNTKFIFLETVNTHTHTHTHTHT